VFAVLHEEDRVTHGDDSKEHSETEVVHEAQVALDVAACSVTFKSISSLLLHLDWPPYLYTQKWDIVLCSSEMKLKTPETIVSRTMLKQVLSDEKVNGNVCTSPLPLSLSCHLERYYLYSQVL